MSVFVEEQKHPLEAPKTNHPFQCSTVHPKNRMRSIPKAVDFGEGIVGSSHLKELFYVPVKGDACFTAVKLTGNITPSLPPMYAHYDSFQSPYAAPTPVSLLDRVGVVFAPTKSGHQAANLNLVFTWEDGQSYEQTVNLTGRARTLQEAPEESRAHKLGESSPLPKPEDLDTADTSKVSGSHVTKYEAVLKLAFSKARSIAHQQRTGLNQAAREAFEYHRAPPDSPPWAWFAEQAIVFGIGGLAAAAAKHLGTFATNKIMSKVSSQALNPERIKSITAYVEHGLTDGFKDALQNATQDPAVKAAIPKQIAPPKAASHFEQAKKAPELKAYRTGEIDFFSAQESALNIAEKNNETRLIHEFEKLRHGLNVDPDATIAQAIAVDKALDSTSNEAAKEQAYASRFQWMAALGHAEQGTDKVRVDGVDVKVTKVDFRRMNEQSTSDDSGSKLSGMLTSNRGHLRLRGRLDGSTFSIKSAAFYGISDEMALKLLDADLSKAPMPVLLIVEGGGLISRDEAGRIRSHGLPVKLTGSSKEEQHYEYSEKVLEGALAQKLSSSVQKIVTDDDKTK